MAADSPIPTPRSGLPKWLRPSWLAGLISVGFHGALFAAGSSFPSLGFTEWVEPELEAEQRDVPLLELTEAEQARLPDFSSSPYNFDSFEDLEPLSPLFESDDPFTSRSPGESSPSTSLNVPSPLTRRRSVPTPTSRIPFGITSLEPRPRTTLPSLPQRDRSTVPGTPTPSTPVSPESAQPRADEGTAADLTAPLPDGAAVPDRSDIARGSSPTEVLTLEDWLQAYTYDNAAEVEPAALQERFGEWLTAGQTLAEDLAVDDFAISADRQSDLLSRSDDDAEAPEAADDDSATTDDAENDAPVAIDDETAELPEAAEDAGTLRSPIVLEIDRDNWVCLARPPQPGLIGAWVSPEGELLGDPAVIRSTGYEGFNRQAIQRVQTLDFSTVNQFAGYQFEVQVNYDADNCLPLAETAPADEDVVRDRANPDADAEADASPEKAPTKEREPDTDGGAPTLLDDLGGPTDDAPGPRDDSPESTPAAPEAAPSTAAPDEATADDDTAE